MPEINIGSMKIALASITGVSQETLHVYAGLAIFGVAVMLFHNKYRLSLALLVVLVVELCNELIDFQSIIANDDPWDWLDTLRDIILTVSAPASFLLLSRYWNIWRHRHRPV